MRERVILVVALGVMVAAIAAAIASILNDPRDGSWFAYAPNTAVAFDGPEPSDWPTVRTALIWIVAAVAWAAPSLWLLRPPRGD